MAPATYAVSFATADGRRLTSQVTLEPDRQYRPEELIITQAAPAEQSGRVLTVSCVELPSEQEFREVAARAATRAARTGDEGRKMINVLIPF